MHLLPLLLDGPYGGGKIVSQNWTSVATRVLQHPWGQRDSIMPRSKEDDAARKQEERSARRGQRGSVMPRSKEDDAARKREERSPRPAARQHRLQHRLSQEAATLGAAMTVAATVDDPVAVETPSA